MKIKALLFDLDGVLIEAKEWHQKALNKALQPYNCVISEADHLSIFDGRPTRTKLKILSRTKGLPVEAHDKVYNDKQKFTVEFIKQYCKPIDYHQKTLQKLKEEGYKLVCCSNAIRPSVRIMLEKADIIKYFDFYLSNQDVGNPKPSPEIYCKAITMLKLKPQECLAIEDNVRGIQSVIDSGAHLLKVKEVDEVNYANIKKRIEEIEGEEETMINIAIPMAGEGRRFKMEGYTKPKPFIDVKGKPMIVRVLENLKCKGARYLLIIRKEHLAQEMELVTKIARDFNAVFIPIESLTEGSACTVLFARKYINNDTPFMLANADQLVDIDIEKFISDLQARTLDGSILTFVDKHKDPKWSFAKINEDGLVTRVEEKVVISKYATVGIYLFSKGKYYVNGAIDMISRNDRVKNEFYNCPVYNYLIREGKRIGIYNIDFEQMHGLGTPEDLKKYLENLK